MWMVVFLLLLVIAVVALRTRRHESRRLGWDWAISREGSLAVVGIVVLAGAFILVGAAWYLSDDLRCPVDGEESNYGEAEWSWFPVGTTCRWTEAQNGLDRGDEPGWLPTLLIASMIVAGLALVFASLTASRRRSGSGYPGRSNVEPR